MALRYHHRSLAARHRPLAARHYQPRNDPVRTLAEAHEDALRDDFHFAFRKLRDLVPIEKIKADLKTGNYRAAIAATPIDQFKHTLLKPFDRIGQIVEAAGHMGAKRITDAFAAKNKKIRIVSKVVSIRKDALQDAFSFNRFDPQTQQEIRDMQDGLIKQLGNDARDVIEAAVMSGVQDASSVEDIAVAIQDSIGLTDTQAQAVANYRTMLEDLDPTTLLRQLRNQEFDPQIQDAIDSGEFLSSDAIDQMTSDYADNYLAYRASTIARTESLRASSIGLHNAYDQAISSEALPSDAVTRQWQVAEDERTCPICLSIPDMNPDGVSNDDAFQSIDGSIDDPPVHPNCRCSVDYVTNLDMVPG